MLAHILRDNYDAGYAQKNIFAGYQKCSSPVGHFSARPMDPMALYTVVKKLLYPENGPLVSYSDMLHVFAGMSEEEWKTLFALGDEYKKLAFILSSYRHIDGRPYGASINKYSQYRYSITFRPEIPLLEPMTENERDKEIWKYIMARTISYLSCLLEIMNRYAVMLKNDANIPYESFYIQEIQALLCAQPWNGYKEADEIDLKKECMALMRDVHIGAGIFFESIECKSKQELDSFHLKIDVIHTLMKKQHFTTGFPDINVIGGTREKITLSMLLNNVNLILSHAVNYLKDTANVTIPDRKCCLITDYRNEVWVMRLCNLDKLNVAIANKKTKMPSTCLDLVIKNQPPMHVPAFIGQDDLGMTCILTPSTYKIATLLRRLYGIQAHDQIIPAYGIESTLLMPESAAFGEEFASWVRNQAQKSTSYCGLTDIISYFRGTKEIGEGESGKPDNLFHKIYID